jgi:hypothetical protein
MAEQYRAEDLAQVMKPCAGRSKFKVQSSTFKSKDNSNRLNSNSRRGFKVRVCFSAS